MEMKKCKECGKLFVPKSSRSQYCDNIHYRPCPVCGKLVEAKYLSDPARCCSKMCQQELKNVKSNQKPSPVAKPIVKKDPPTLKVSDSFSTEDVVVPSQIISSEDYLDLVVFGSADENQELELIYELEDSLRAKYNCMTFIGKRKSSNFVPGHEYALEIVKQKGEPYKVRALYDFKKSSRCSATMTIESKPALEKVFTHNAVRILEDGSLEVLQYGYDEDSE